MLFRWRKIWEVCTKEETKLGRGNAGTGTERRQAQAGGVQQTNKKNGNRGNKERMQVLGGREASSNWARKSSQKQEVGLGAHTHVHKNPQVPWLFCHQKVKHAINYRAGHAHSGWQATVLINSNPSNAKGLSREVKLFSTQWWTKPQLAFEELMQVCTGCVTVREQTTTTKNQKPTNQKKHQPNPKPKTPTNSNPTKSGECQTLGLPFDLLLVCYEHASCCSHSLSPYQISSDFKAPQLLLRRLVNCIRLWYFLIILFTG